MPIFRYIAPMRHFYDDYEMRAATPFDLLPYIRHTPRERHFDTIDYAAAFVTHRRRHAIAADY